MTEDNVRALRTTIADNLATKLSAIETARSVTITAIAAEDITVGFRFARRFPRIEILPASTNYDYGDSDLPRVEATGEDEFEVVISRAGSESDSAEMFYDLMRYGEAVTEIIIANPELGLGDDVVAYVESAEWVDVRQAIESKQIALALALTVRVMEHAPAE